VVSVTHLPGVDAVCVPILG